MGEIVKAAKWRSNVNRRDATMCWLIILKLFGGTRPWRHLYSRWALAGDEILKRVQIESLTIYIMGLKDDNSTAKSLRIYHDGGRFLDDDLTER